MAEGNAASSTAIVAIVILVLAALLFFYFMFQSAGDSNGEIEINVPGIEEKQK